MTAFPLRRRPFLAALAGLATVSSASAVESTGQKTRIGIIGTGHVGTTLAELWVHAGYHVMVSARSLTEAQSLATSLGPLATAGTPAQAAAYGDIVVLAVPYGAIPQLGPQLSRTLLDKVVLDPSNPYPWRRGDCGYGAEGWGGCDDPALFPIGACGAGVQFHRHDDAPF